MNAPIKMKIGSQSLAVIVLVVIFGGIAASSALGFWNTGPIGGGQGSGSSEGSGVSAFIRGRSTFQDLLDLGLSQETIERVIGGSMPSPSTRINFYCTGNGLDFETVKLDLEQELLQLDD